VGDDGWSGPERIGAQVRIAAVLVVDEAPIDEAEARLGVEGRRDHLVGVLLDDVRAFALHLELLFFLLLLGGRPFSPLPTAGAPLGLRDVLFGFLGGRLRGRLGFAFAAAAGVRGVFVVLGRLGHGLRRLLRARRRLALFARAAELRPEAAPDRRHD